MQSLKNVHPGNENLKIPKTEEGSITKWDGPSSSERVVQEIQEGLCIVKIWRIFLFFQTCYIPVWPESFTLTIVYWTFFFVAVYIQLVNVGWRIYTSNANTIQNLVGRINTSTIYTLPFWSGGTCFYSCDKRLSNAPVVCWVIKKELPC